MSLELCRRKREREGNTPVYEADGDVPALVRDEGPDVGEDTRGRRRGDHDIECSCATLAYSAACIINRNTHQSDPRVGLPISAQAQTPR